MKLRNLYDRGTLYNHQKQPSKGVLKKRCSEIMQQICRRTLIPKCHFNKFALQLRHGCSPVNLLHIFITRFSKKTPGRLLLNLHDVSFIIPISIRASLGESCKMKIFSEVVSFISCRGFSKFN